MTSHAVIGCCGWLCRHIVKDVRRAGRHFSPKIEFSFGSRREFRKNPVIDNDIKEAVDRIATGLYSPSQNWEIFHW
jgi:hypothetical protein